MRAGEQLEFLFPEARFSSPSEVAAKLFSVSQPFTVSQGNFASLLTRVPAPEPTGRRRVTDALAVAAVQASDGSRPRAVVLVLGQEQADTSAYGILEVRQFLKDLQVPLLIWWTGLPSSVNISEDRRPLRVKTAWGAATDISSVSRFRQAIGVLRRELDGQSTVWVEGSHLPQSITVSEQSKKLHLTGF
jgi:hypothetical protein